MKNLILIAVTLLTFSCKNCNSQLKNKSNKVKLVNITIIKDYLDSQTKKDSLHGIVLIADKDDVILKKAFGFKDLNQTQKHTINEKIGLASIPKMFTVIAIM
ncbi:hypothetical protein BTO06_16005 [Tenacibaculum sp. SZ-18]|uniref:serine hydrolase n=1 Tax=Tenacibaculum sp. SZ-18 TaxID=754423 RepID=UPI000C2D0ACD|nr:hypothetical protein BTO06_16005 [Tenacibaculum sp. SZ-18]